MSTELNSVEKERETGEEAVAVDSSPASLDTGSSSLITRENVPLGHSFIIVR